VKKPFFTANGAADGNWQPVKAADSEYRKQKQVASIFNLSLKSRAAGIPHLTVFVRTKCGFSRKSPKKMKENRKTIEPMSTSQEFTFQTGFERKKDANV